jgi:hypothetical protein
MSEQYTEEDVQELWYRTADEYGSEFSDEYPVGEAIQDYRVHCYERVLQNVLAIKDDLETERYHAMMREEEEQDFIDFEKEY